MPFPRSSRHWLAALLVVTAFAASAWVASMFMRRAYESEVFVLVAKDSGESSISSIASQLGGVAALLGSSAVGGSDINSALATLRSRRLTGEFLQAGGRFKLLADLLHSEQFDALNESDQVQAAISYFLDHIVAVSYDARSGLITVSVTWFDRSNAAEWANAYVAQANELMRREEIQLARAKMQFLEKAAASAETIDLRQSTYRLIEAQVRSEMVASTKPDFAFHVIDPAVPALPMDFVRPKRYLMTMLAGLAGALLFVGWQLLASAFNPRVAR